ncbi:MAG: MFS transporter [Candidatus Bathyarchaeia archaeon]
MKDRSFKLTLAFLLTSSFLAQMIVGIVGITVPIYAVEMDASPLLLGIIGATGGLVYSFMPLVSGILSDRFRRKIFIFSSTFFYGLSCIFYTLAENPYMLIPIKALEWVSVAMFWPPTEALLVEVSFGKLEEALKKFNLSWGSAMIIGPMIGGSLISALGVEAKAPFFLSSAISLTLSFLALIIVKEPPREIVPHEHKIFKFSESKSHSIISALISILLFSSLIGMILNLFPAYATILGIPAYEVGLMMLVNGLWRLVAFFEAYKIKAKIGVTHMFFIGSIMLASASASMAISSTTFMFSISLSILGFGAGILYAASIANILESQKAARGQAAGLFETLIGIGYFLGSLSGGFVAEYAPNAPYILGLFLSLLASTAHAFYGWKNREKLKFQTQLK